MKRTYTSPNRRRLKAPRSKQKGMTLIEMGVVIILILIVMAFAAGRIGGIFGKSETAEEVAALTQLIVNTKTLRGASGYGTASLVPALIAIEAVPSSMSVQANTIRNAWAGTVTVVGTGLGFRVTTPSVPKAACVEVANKISRGGGMSTSINGASQPGTAEVTAVAAATACNSDSNTIIFTVNS